MSLVLIPESERESLAFKMKVPTYCWRAPFNSSLLDPIDQSNLLLRAFVKACSEEEKKSMRNPEYYLRFMWWQDSSTTQPYVHGYLKHIDKQNHNYDTLMKIGEEGFIKFEITFNTYARFLLAADSILYREIDHDELIISIHGDSSS